MTQIRTWAIVAVVAIAAVFAAGWFMLLSPQHAKAAKLSSDAASQQATNDGLRLQIARMKKESANVPAEQARITAIDSRIPATPALPAYVRFLASTAASTHVELVAIAPTAPTPLQLQVRAPAPQAATDTAGATSTAVPAAVPAPVSAMSGISISIGVVGDYFAIQQFLAHLEKSSRSTVVSSVALSPGSLPQGVAPATGGPAGAAPPGWQTLSAQVTLTIFMSTAPASAGAVGSGAATTPAAGSAATAQTPAAPATQQPKS
jgi:Tfp pilus assembly protein PilO